MTNKIKAEIITHSKRNNTGEEIITYKLTFPRIILSEVNTYKMLEKNTSSCLSGDTFIEIFSKEKNKYDTVQIKHLFELQKNGLELPEIISFNLRDKEYRTGDIYEENFIKQKINRVFKSGVKKVYRIHFNKGLYLDCTSEHRLLSYEYGEPYKWITLNDFQIEEKEDNVFGDFSLIFKPLYSISVTESEINNIYSEKIEEIRFFGFNPTIQSRNDGKINNRYTLRYITRVSYLGEMETYDIEVDGKYHNFIANSIVVHNSRAIPFEKMVEVVEKEPFIPIAWSKLHKGMQGNDYYTDPIIVECKEKRWLEARDAAVTASKNLDIDIISTKKPVFKDVRDVIEGDNYETVSSEFINPTTKQLKNRLLEPFMWTTQLITGTRESFEHLFEQRCPIYELEVCPDSVVYARSKKEFIEHYNCFEDKDDLWWLQHNKGQAEIHFMDLAEKMYDALNESTPKGLYSEEWHIPFREEILKDKESKGIEDLGDLIKMSVCLTAKISYTKIGDENSITIEKAREMYERLKNAGHWSCFGHIAKCMTDKEYKSWYKGFIDTKEYINSFGEVSNGLNCDNFVNAQGYNKNLKGFISLRQYVEDGIELKDI